jgi:hypothetical protein
MRGVHIVSVIGHRSRRGGRGRGRVERGQRAGHDLQENRDCADGVWCNGQERCTDIVNGVGRCAPGTSPTCNPDQDCFEGPRACITVRGPCVQPDADNDGHLRIECGGDDCDDHDSLRFPHRPEVCDGNAHDEDCDPTTFGDKDNDKDGFFDAKCCNRDANGTLICGTDPDDQNPSVQHGSQTCAGPRSVRIGNAVHPCPAALTCVTQPNGLGACQYVPPPQPAPCTIRGSRVPHGAQSCSHLNPERVYLCEDGLARLDRCPGGTICVQQLNGTGWCQIKPPGWTPPTQLSAPAVSVRPTPTSPLPPPVPRPPPR